jgi:hypothetical protein
MPGIPFAKMSGVGNDFILLSGGARFVAEGVLHPEAWSWPEPGLHARPTSGSAATP